MDENTLYLTPSTLTAGTRLGVTKDYEIHAGMPELIIWPYKGLVETVVFRHVTRIYTGPEQMP